MDITSATLEPRPCRGLKIVNIDVALLRGEIRKIRLQAAANPRG